MGLPVGHLQQGQFFIVAHGPKAVISNLFLIQNLTGVDSLEAPLWSLPYEMQMYFVLPILFQLSQRFRSVRPLLAVWCLVVGNALVWRHWPSFLAPGFVPCFLAGVVAYKIARIANKHLPYQLWPIALIAVSVAYLKWPTDAAGWLGCLALGILLPYFQEIPPGPFARTFERVARYSYGLYLTHFILIWFCFVRIGSLPWSLRAAIFVALLIVVPILLYHLVEEPMIAMGARLVRRWGYDVGSAGRVQLSLAVDGEAKRGDRPR